MSDHVRDSLNGPFFDNTPMLQRYSAKLSGRAPWNWARLPGLDCFERCHGVWCRPHHGEDFLWVPFGAKGVEPFHPRYGRPWITSERRSQSTSGAGQ